MTELYSDSERTKHSTAGIASLVIALLPGVPIVLLAIPAYLLAVSQPADADTVAIGFGVLMLALMTFACEVVAFCLGLTGLLQRSRRKLYAYLGVTCSVSVIAALFVLNAVLPK